VSHYDDLQEYRVIYDRNGHRREFAVKRGNFTVEWPARFSTGSDLILREAILTPNQLKAGDGGWEKVDINYSQQLDLHVMFV
jgi:hypothetical protein